MKILTNNTIQVDQDYWQKYGGHLYDTLNDSVGHDNYRIVNKMNCDKKIIFSNPNDIVVFMLRFERKL